MTMYEYKCPVCGTRAVSGDRSNRLATFCLTCEGMVEYRRVFSFSAPQVMHEHFNRTVGKPISDMKQFARELSKQSDLATERTGIEHRYVPVEAGDAAAVGATNEGIAESNRVRASRGEPLLPEIH